MSTATDRRRLAAERQRRKRERDRAGKLRLTVEVDEIGLGDAFIRVGLMSPSRADDREALQQVAEYVLNTWASSVTRDNSC